MGVARVEEDDEVGDKRVVGDSGFECAARIAGVENRFLSLRMVWRGS